MKVDVTMTATWRPELIDRTLESFFENLFSGFSGDLRLVINIDPVGSENNRYKDVIRVCSKYFKEIKATRPSRAFFPKAFLTVWNLARAPYLFHLEEDWLLKRKLDFNEMIEIMEDNITLAHLRLSKFRSTSEHLKNWKHFFLWNGKFFECPQADKGAAGWCGHPSLNRTAFAKGAIARIDPVHNPEKQIKGRWMGDYLNQWRFGIYHPQEAPPCLEDIGRKWMEENGWRKSGNPQHFTCWEKI